MRALTLLSLTCLLAACDVPRDVRPPLELDSDRDRSTTRVPAEWEAQESVWIQWPQDHEASYQDSFVKIVDVVCRYEPVDILVVDGALEASARATLSSAGVPLENVRFHRGAYDAFWMRDNGPVYVEDASGMWVQDWGFDAYGARPGDDIWYDRDDRVPALLGGVLGAAYEDLNGYILERGNLEANGVDAVALNWDCQQSRNPGMSRADTEALLADTLGATRVIWVEGHDPLDGTTGHIDGLLRFVDEDTVLIASRPNPADALFSGEAAMLESAVHAPQA